MLLYLPFYCYHHHLLLCVCEVFNAFNEFLIILHHVFAPFTLFVKLVYLYCRLLMKGDVNLRRAIFMSI